MLTNGKYQPIKFTNNRQVFLLNRLKSENGNPSVFDQLNFFESNFCPFLTIFSVITNEVSYQMFLKCQVHKSTG